MRDSFARDDVGILELDLLGKAREPGLAGAEQNGNEIDGDDVEQPELQALASDVGAGDGDRARPGG